MVEVLTLGIFLFLYENNQFVCTLIWLVDWKKEIQLKNARSFAGNTRLLLIYSSCIMTCRFSLTEAWYRIAHGKGDFSVVISWF